MVKPTFLCIGVQKAGTTSLIQYLNQHPDIFMQPSESHFFDDTPFTDATIITYENTFNTTKSIVGEKSPSYNYLQYTIDRIYIYNPNIKLILILREPISRAFSEYNMVNNLNNKHDNEILLDFQKEENILLKDLKHNGLNYIVRGKYDEIITYILSKFSRENLYIGIAEEICANKDKYYNEIFSFLGAAPLQNINKNVDMRIGGYVKHIPKKLETRLYNIYKDHNERLYNILGRKIDIWEKYYDTLKSSDNV